MSCHTLYDVLECSNEASYEDLKRSYRRLVLQHHPDKMKTANSDSNETFRRIESAWTILRDAESRRKYDAECRQAWLESLGGPVHATIRVDEMENSPDGETFSYGCRCGSYYTIDRLAASQDNCSYQIPCQDCTFVLVVET